jgi:hypothetical protein
MASFVAASKGWAFIDFGVDEGLAFLDAIARAGARDAFYVRMVHWAAPDAWRVEVKPYDAAMFDETVPSRFHLPLMNVMFPQFDIGEIVRRLNDHANGQLVPPASTDWSTVGR